MEHYSEHRFGSALAIGLAMVALTGCETSSPQQPVAISSHDALPSPSESPAPIAATASPVIPRAPAPGNPIVSLQRALNNELVPLGMPRLTTDGKAGRQTKRALCAERLFTGNGESRADASPADKQRINGHETFSHTLTGFVISRTCQVMGVNIDNKLTMILPISTGKPGHATPAGDFSVAFGRNDLHNSTKYPVKGKREEGNMYRPQYFDFSGVAAIAIHGSSAMTPAATYPACGSHWPAIAAALALLPACRPCALV